MKTLRERIHRLLGVIGSPVEKTACDELSVRTVMVSGAMAGLLATLSLLGVAHLGDVVVLRHYYAFLIGYIFTVFSSVGLILIHTVVGAIAAYVYLRAEEYLGSGKWLALACFFPLFASTGTFVAEGLTEAAGLGMSPSAPVLRVVMTVLATLAMTWLFWFPWLSFYRICLNRCISRQRLRQLQDDVKTLEVSRHRDSAESARSYMRVRREIALIRKHRSGNAGKNGLSELDMLTGLSVPVDTATHAPMHARDVGRGDASRRRRAGLIGIALLAVLVLATLSSSKSLPGVLRGVIGQDGASSGGEAVRIWVKATGLDPELVENLTNRALDESGTRTTVDAVDINQFSILAVRTLMFDGVPDLVISSRQDLREMADQGMLMDLTPLIERDHVDLDSFVDSCIAELSTDGAVFGLPLSTSPLLLYINTKSLNYTGLSPHTPPILWADLLGYTKALTWFTNLNGTPAVSQLGFAPTDHLWRIWLQLAADASLSGSSPAHQLGLADTETQDAAPRGTIPDEWQLLVNMASSLRATMLPDNASSYRNPFYERQHNPEALFASGQLAMVVADHRLHTALSRNYPDLEYAVADIPVPDWQASGAAFSDGLGVGMFLPRSDSSEDPGSYIEASWQAAKAVATDPEIQAQIAESSGLLPGLESLLDDSAVHNAQLRNLSLEDDEIEDRFHASQLRAMPTAGDATLPPSSLPRIYGLLNRLVHGVESVPYVLEQIKMTIETHSRARLID